jgi:hypothetical protein
MVSDNLVQTVEVEACVHHWEIDTAAGASSEGRCKKCGEERMFRNSVKFSFQKGNKEKLKSICSEPKCLEQVSAKGKCKAHYQRSRKEAKVVV